MQNCFLVGLNDESKSFLLNIKFLGAKQGTKGTPKESLNSRHSGTSLQFLENPSFGY